VRKIGENETKSAKAGKYSGVDTPGNTKKTLARDTGKRIRDKKKEGGRKAKK